MLLSALAPTVSHAMMGAKKDPAFFVEICSATGNKLVATVFGKQSINKEQPADQNSESKGMVHCGYCTNHAGTWAFPVYSPSLVLSVNLSYSLPALFYQSPRPLFTWASSSPRAPPFLS